MSLPRYRHYKSSGTDWLGEVPSHWQVVPLWTLFRRVKRSGHQQEQLLSIYREFGVVPKASRDDNNNKPSDDLSLYQLVEPGDLAINKMKAWQGAVAISGHRGIVSPAYFIYEPLHSEDARFLHYLLRSPRYITGYRSFSKGIRVNQWDLEPQYHSRMPVLLPSKEEQSAISTFLDRETAKVDALIAQQERLMVLLNEKRQATISHAVTRGLSPTARTKDSGLEWLGEVPAHWRMLRVKALSQFSTSGPRGWSECITEEGSLFIQSGDLNDLVGIEFQTAKRVTAEDDAEAARTRLADGDVVVCITGAKTGNVALCAGLREPAYVNQHLCLIRPVKELVAGFLAFALKGDVGQRQFELSQYGLKQGLSLENVRELCVPVPPRDEQEAIVAFLQAEMARLTSLANSAVVAVNLLKERRAALIAAAVTGQVDIRET
jgi:type I restriction enzyme S subunit